MAGKLGADEVFRTLFEYCSRKPDAMVDHPWGEVVLKVRGKIFAYLGRPGESQGVTVKPAPEELQELLARPDVELAHYIGRFGWVNLSVHDAASMKLAMRLVDETYEQIAKGKKGAAAKKGAAPATKRAAGAKKAGAKKEAGAKKAAPKKAATKKEADSKGKKPAS